MKKLVSFGLVATLVLSTALPTLAAGSSMVFVPLRSTFEGIGATVEWNQNEGSAIINFGGQKAKLVVGTNNVVVDGKNVALDGSTFIENGRTMIPLNSFAGAFESSNIIKAKASITSFTTGDTSVANSILPDGYIQHNLAFGTGRDAFVAAVDGLSAAPTKTTVKNIRAFEDGNYVFLQTVYNFAGAGEQVAFDVFRFENGKIAEHWDNLANIAKPNPSGHTQIDGTTTIKDLDKTEANKTIVSNFVRDVLRGENMGALTTYFDGDNYIQHNTDIADGLSGLGTALEELAKAGISMVYDKTHMVLGQGNFVLVASEGSFGGVPTTYYDLFRVENGKIAEHWDVMETLMPEKDWANQNGKFGKTDETTEKSDVKTAKNVSLNVGAMQVYDYGNIKLHAYQSKDAIADEAFLLETEKEIIAIELVGFYDNINELQKYIKDIGKPLTSVIVAYHPAGGDQYTDSKMYAMDGLGEAALVPGFVEAFGKAFDGNLPTKYELVKPGTMTIGGIKFNVIKTADAFDLEIPAINCYFTHMVGSNTHNILVSNAQIDEMIAQMKDFQSKKYNLILTGHDVPRTIEVAAEKIAYLEKTKGLVAASKNASEFMQAMKTAFPNYYGENFLEMSANVLYK